MINFLLALSVYTILFLLFYASIKTGYRFALWRRAHQSQNQLSIVKVAEGAVFALLGLLVAFSFSSAYERFENRKLKIIDEINAMETTYYRVGLLKPAIQPLMRQTIMHYVNDRIAAYQRLAELHGLHTELVRFRASQATVWAKTIEAVNITGNHASTLLFVQAVNDMFEIANTRMMITRIHPPIPIFILLIGLGALSSFLAGYSMAKNEKYSLVYTLCLVAITAFTIYIIIDLEFPRIGMIRIDGFDHLLVESANELK